MSGDWNVLLEDGNSDWDWGTVVITATIDGYEISSGADRQ